MSALSSYPILLQVLDILRSDPRQEPEVIKTKIVEWSKELEAAGADQAAIDEILREHRANPTEVFWRWLESFIFCGGFGKPVKTFSRILADQLIHGLQSTQRQALLNALNDRQSSYFFSAGRWVTSSLIVRYFPINFIADWITSRFIAYGDDGAVGDLWRLMQKLAEENPDYAFELAETRAFSATPDGRKFKLELLGGMRFRSGLSMSLTKKLSAVLDPMGTSSDAAERADYWRTMKRPLAKGRLPDEELGKALAATAISPEEYNVGYELAKSGSQFPTPKAQTLRLLKWLYVQLEQSRTPSQQYDIATVVWLTVEHITPEELGFDLADMLLKIQPVDQAHRGIWRQIESSLYPLSNLNRERFHKVIRSIAREHWPVLLKMLEQNAPLHGTMVRLSERPEETAAFAADLLASKIQGERRLGFYLIENLQLPEIAKPVTTFSREEFTIWISEFRLSIAYKTVAQQLVDAGARIDKSDTDMVCAFHEEVLYQCKNLPGLCLSKLKLRKADAELFDRPIAEADEYFEALKQLDDSAIKAQQIPGLVRALRRKRVRDRVKMDEAVAAHSLFEQFVKKSYLLYGSRWSTFNGGKLGKAGPLQTHSISTEYPRKACIDPEGLLGMKLAAQAELNRLNPAVEDPQ